MSKAVDFEKAIDGCFYTESSKSTQIADFFIAYFKSGHKLTITAT